MASGIKEVGEIPFSGFKFEEDFMEDNIRCIPMMVRFKLDASGIKLKLSEWHRLTLSERTNLADLPTTTQDEVVRYRQHVQQLISSRTGKKTTEQAIDNNPAWAMMDRIQESLLEKLKEYNWTLSLKGWQGLSNLQRFALIKLSRPGHRNKNFPKAMKEFNLVT
jgi:hypothetical protein